MKFLISAIGLLSMVLAEPPVGDGYPAARSHDHYQDFSRSIPQEYGLPETRSSQNGLSNEYGLPTSSNTPVDLPMSLDYLPPNARTSGTRKYSPPAATVSITHNYKSRSKGQARNSQGYARTPSQDYGVPSSISEDLRGIVTPSVSEFTRTSSEYSSPRLDQEYGVPNTRGVSQEYGLPKSISAEYNAPVFSTLSSEYGIPDARSTPTDEYGAPAITRSNSKGKSFNYNAKSFSNSQTFAKSSNISPFRSNVASQTYSAPKPLAKSGFSSVSAKTSHNSLGYAARDSDSYSQEYNAPSESYGLPAVRDLSDTYGAPGLSQEYGSPSRANLKTNAIASSYSSARSSPSSTYLPSARSMPSEQYGTPEQYASNQGYNYARSLEDSYQQEPANYGFTYKVNDLDSGSDFGHSETREENRAEGSYFVLLPDGTKQTVEYEADEDGFKPRISVEQPSARGYDDNASSEGY